MLYTKLYGNRSNGSGVKIFEGFLTYEMGMAVILVM